MRKLFLVALVVGLCTPVIMAQEPAKAGIYGGLQNLRFDAYGTSKQDAEQESAKTAIYGGLLNLHHNLPETSNQDINSLPQAPKPTSLSDISNELGRRYAINPPLNSRDAAGGAGSPVQCPPNCAGREYNRIEIYGGYSLLSYDFRFFDIFSTTPVTTTTSVNVLNLDRQRRFHLNGGDVSVTVNFTRYLGAQFDFSGHRRDFNNFDTSFVVLNQPIFGNLLVFADIPRPEFSVLNFLGGIQVKDNRKDGPRARPFGHLLLGASRERLRIRGVNLITDLNHDGVLDSFTFNNTLRFTRTSFSLAVGGGFDIRLTDHFSIRPIKIDYLPIFARPAVLLFTPPLIVPPIFPPTIPPGANFSLSVVNTDRGRITKNNFRIGAGVVFHF